MTNRVVMGIDPGLNKTGWAFLIAARGQKKYLRSGTLVTNLSDGLPFRIHKIFATIYSLVEQYKPNEIALEETYVNINSKTSLYLAHARAAAMIGAAEHGLQVMPYQAKTIKKIVTGSGNADKEQVAKMLKLQIQGIDNISDKDAIDALALAFCHAHLKTN